jgi:small subunit ribosomal protein S20
MPHTKSAEKRLRQTEKRRKRNRTITKSIKLQVRAVHDAVKTGDTAKTRTEMVSAARTLDKAASRKAIHKNKAARLKSRLAKRLNKAVAANK